MATLRQHLKAAIRRTANAIGYDIVGYDGSSRRARLAMLLRRHGIETIVDVGANIGQFGRQMRELGYRGDIVSFEPLPDAFPRLQEAAAGDPRWKTVNIGLGAAEAQHRIHVAANSQSSSILPMLASHRDAAPESSYVGSAPIFIRRLDAVAREYWAPGRPIFLKIDTQGYEKQVLEGADAVLPDVKLLQMECSLVPLYEGAELIEDLIGASRACGFIPVDIAPTFHHRDNLHLMQADVLFARSESAPRKA
jgi:FkbM family methyltransferase